MARVSVMHFCRTCRRHHAHACPLPDAATRCVLKHSSLASSLASVLATKVKYNDLPGAFALTAEGGARADLAIHEEALRETFYQVSGA